MVNCLQHIFPCPQPCGTPSGCTTCSETTVSAIVPVLTIGGFSGTGRCCGATLNGTWVLSGTWAYYSGADADGYTGATCRFISGTFNTTTPCVAGCDPSIGTAEIWITYGSGVTHIEVQVNIGCIASNTLTTFLAADFLYSTTGQIDCASVSGLVIPFNTTGSPAPCTGTPTCTLTL